MSRLGKLPVAIPEKVEAKVEDNQIKIKGPKGELITHFTGDVTVEITDGNVVVSPANDSKRSRSMWGTIRSNVANDIKGVVEGYSKTLEIIGVGYRSNLVGKMLTLSLGYSHEIKYILPEGIECAIEKQTKITLSGINKQLVGQVSAEIRALRKPEPYKGKGVRYSDEYIRRKEGKKK